MQPRMYGKTSIIAKIVRWYYGYLPDSDTCNVRKVVLFLAPWKLLTNPRVFGREYPIGLVWLQVLVLWGALVLRVPDDVSTAATALKVACISVLVLEAAGVALVIGSFLVSTVSGAIQDMPAAKKASREVKRTITNFIGDSWDYIYHKVCKPVRWG